ncbi:MAG: hypothetical protein PVJ51_01320 [Acidobacteriota bacterium]
MRTLRIPAIVFATACGLLLTFPVTADTVYLKNGRTIDTSSVRVEGERVIVRLFGGEVSFPLSVVDRIEENTAVERATAVPSAVTPEAGDAEQAVNPEEGAGPGGAGDQAAAAQPADEPPPTPPEQTREYWQNRLRPLQDEIDRIDGEIDGLQGNTGADIQARIDRLGQRRARVMGQMDAIVREGRRMGVPAGWLRIR